jgi:hypothetical protein
MYAGAPLSVWLFVRRSHLRESCCYTATVKTFQYDHLPIDDGAAGAKGANSANFPYIPSGRRELFVIRSRDKSLAAGEPSQASALRLVLGATPRGVKMLMGYECRV